MIRLLVSTTITQGWRDSDFCYVPEGEILIYGFECDRDGEDIDGSCGCKRALRGIKSDTATTTFRVEAFPGMKVKDLKAMVKEYLFRNGWINSRIGNVEEADQIAQEFTEDLLMMTMHLKPGQIVEKRGDVYKVREVELPKAWIMDE